MVFHWFFTWIVLRYADLHFLLILVMKANAVEGGTTSAMWLYHQRNQTIHVTDGVTVTSLSASLQHKTQAAMDHICQIILNKKLSHYCPRQITLNRKLSRKFEKWCKFSSHVKAKSHKKKLSTMRLACSFFFLLFAPDDSTQHFIKANTVCIMTDSCVHKNCLHHSQEQCCSVALVHFCYIQTRIWMATICILTHLPIHKHAFLWQQHTSLHTHSLFHILIKQLHAANSLPTTHLSPSQWNVCLFGIWRPTKMNHICIY
jgi:hypothetical protein